MKKKAMDLVMLVLSVLLSGGVMTVFRACSPKEDGTWMHCHHAQMIVFCLGVVLTVLTIVSMFIQNQKIKMWLKIVTGLVCVAAMLVPGTLVKMCMMNDMRCHSVMKPFVWVLGGLLLLASVFCVVQICLSKEK